jgi:hypothetical protein
LPQDQPRVNLAKAVVRKKTAPIGRPWSKDDVRDLKSMTRKEPVTTIAKALKRTDEATRQKATVIGLSLKLAPQERASAKNGRGKASRRAADFVVNMAPSDVRSTIASCCGARLRHPSHDW